MMKKLLLTGFDPFAHYNINPSWEAVKALPEVIGSFSVHNMLLPNIYGTAGRMLLEEAERLKPDVILMTGMDSGSRMRKSTPISVQPSSFADSSRPSGMFWKKVIMMIIL